ncbi:MAG: ABC transporter substrate-binding protein [Candidatus Aminicenantes bacterium]|nr:ABC transporter substrate-binding protein [Candidatus Aminicenantes bacterium]
MRAGYANASSSILLAVFLFAGGQDVVRDDLGAVFPAAGSYRRIVSLAPNITEILFTLGAGDRVAGVTRYCDFPPEAALRPKVGGFLDPNLEAIRALEPDLIVAFRGNPLEALDRLRRIGLPVFVLDIADDLEAVPRTIGKLGRLTGRTAEAGAIIDGIAAVSRSVEEGLRGLAERPRIFLKLQGEGLWTCGRGSYFTDMIVRSGGTSISAGVPKNWLEYGAERLLADDPDLIVILARSDDDYARTRGWFRAQPALRGLRAVREDRFGRLDENAASRFGPRLFEAFADLARLLHPDRFPAR